MFLLDALINPKFEVGFNPLTPVEEINNLPQTITEALKSCTCGTQINAVHTKVDLPNTIVQVTLVGECPLITLNELESILECSDIF